MNPQIVEIGRHLIELSHPEKIIFPDVKVTKRDLVDYYQKIAPIMLPHMKDHPLNMQRFPDGIGSSGFYEKEIPGYFPEWIDRVRVKVKEQDRSQEQVVCNQAATLIYLANQACITPHVWLSRMDQPNQPDKLIFDLDPPGDDFQPVREAAWAFKDILEKVELTPFVMTTGSRGLHIVAPIQTGVDFDTSRRFARDLCQVLAERDPENLTVEMRKEQRGGRLFLDYLRNSYAQTAVAPYALRPKPQAPVATPLDWNELKDDSLGSQSYTIENIFRRLGQKDDPWKNIQRHADSLENAWAQIQKLQRSN